MPPQNRPHNSPRQRVAPDRERQPDDDPARTCVQLGKRNEDPSTGAQEEQGSSEQPRCCEAPEHASTLDVTADATSVSARETPRRCLAAFPESIGNCFVGATSGLPGRPASRRPPTLSRPGQRAQRRRPRRPRAADEEHRCRSSAFHVGQAGKRPDVGSTRPRLGSLEGPDRPPLRVHGVMSVAPDSGVRRPFHRSTLRAIHFDDTAPVLVSNVLTDVGRANVTLRLPPARATAMFASVPIEFIVRLIARLPM